MNNSSLVMPSPVLRAKKKDKEKHVAGSMVQAIMSRLQDPRDQQMHLIVSTLTLMFDAALTALIIARVPYTEIDWEAYMQEVEGFLGGELDYINLKGGTGPLVYPAGFVYLFSGIRWVTSGSVFPAQVLFAAVYLLTQAVVMLLYVKSEAMPPYLHIVLSLSKRMHSIYVLRLFNDCWTMLIAYGAVYLLMTRQFAAAITGFSLAVSTKMNVLLFAPGVLVACLVVRHLHLLSFCTVSAIAARIQDVAVGVALGFVLQIGLAAPFLAVAPESYLSRAFEFSRAFFYKWTVNWRMVPEDVFLSPQFAAVLLSAHLTLLGTFSHYRWTAGSEGIWKTLLRFLTGRKLCTAATTRMNANASEDTVTHEPHAMAQAQDSSASLTRPRTRSVTARASAQKDHVSGRKAFEGAPGSTGQKHHGSLGAHKHVSQQSGDAILELSNGELVEIVLCSNLIGMLCARSLHYQFYCWYFHSLPFLLWRTQFPLVVRCAFLIAIEWCWNVFPSTNASSSVLLASHICCLCGLWFFRGQSTKEQAR